MPSKLCELTIAMSGAVLSVRLVLNEDRSEGEGNECRVVESCFGWPTRVEKHRQVDTHEIRSAVTEFP